MDSDIIIIISITIIVIIIIIIIIIIRALDNYISAKKNKYPQQ